jgi:Zn-dependent protease
MRAHRYVEQRADERADERAEKGVAMNTGTIRLGDWFGIRVQVHWSVLVIALVLGSGLGRIVGVVPAAVGVVAFLASILAHEFSHALTARRFGVGTRSVQLWALGGVARLDREAPTARAEGWIAAAGPIASVAVAVVAVGTWWLAGGSDTSNAYIGVLGWIGVVNAALAVFNLLPGAPLDGGRIVKAVRWGRHGDRYRAAREAGQSGVVIGWMLAALGFGLILRSENGIWLLVTGLFVAINARFEMSAAALASRLSGIRIRDLTWFGLAQAGDELDADSMLWQRRRLGGAGGVAVTDRSGEVRGVVLEEELWALPADERPWVLLTQLMVPFDRTVQAAPDDELTSVLARIDPRRPIVTVWDEGRLVGMVPPKVLKARLGLT